MPFTVTVPLKVLAPLKRTVPTVVPPIVSVTPEPPEIRAVISRVSEVPVIRDAEIVALALAVILPANPIVPPETAL